MHVPPTRPAVPSQHAFAGYEIVAKLRVGGMAALYLGRKTGAGGFAKYVAIKVVLEQMSEDPMLISMFLDEARLSARIEHPNVVHIHELGEEDGQHFLVMEYIAGASLAQLQRALTKRGRRLAPAIVASIGMQVAAGLHAAHEVADDHGVSLNVVHRDVSPKNVLLAYKGYVKLIDFGIAKVRDASQSTSAGLLKGTIRYMSPEQALGRASIDRRSDIFSLGTVLWEMLTGRPLFQAENDLGVLDLVRRAEALPPGHYAPVSPALEQVVMRMLALSPADRFASADEVQRALAAAVPEALGVSAQQVGEVVAMFVPPANDGKLDPAVSSALGRPIPVRDPDALLASATMPVDGSVAGVESSSGVSGAMPRGHAQSQGLASSPGMEPAISRPSVETGPISAASAAFAPPPPAAPDASAARPPWKAIAAVAGLVALALVATGIAWSAMRGSSPEITSTPIAVERATPPSSVPAPTTVGVAPQPTAVEVAAPSTIVPLAPATPAPSTDPTPVVSGHAPPRPRAHPTSSASASHTAPATTEVPTTAAIATHHRSQTHLTGDPVISTEF